jgi:hypothetical protein
MDGHMSALPRLSSFPGGRVPQLLDQACQAFVSAPPLGTISTQSTPPLPSSTFAFHPACIIATEGSAVVHPTAWPKSQTHSASNPTARVARLLSPHPRYSSKLSAPSAVKAPVVRITMPPRRQILSPQIKNCVITPLHPRAISPWGRVRFVYSVAGMGCFAEISTLTFRPCLRLVDLDRPG